MRGEIERWGWDVRVGSWELGAVAGSLGQGTVGGAWCWT